jgi:hypothetical protein
MANIKLVAESFSEYQKGPESLNEEQLNESSKGLLQKFLKNPEKNQDAFVKAYAAQTSKKGGDKLKNALSKLDIEDKKNLAQQSLEALEDSKKGYAWAKVRDNKIVGAGAVGIQKGQLGKELGQ